MKMGYPNPFKQSLTGEEIKTWIWYNANNNTSFSSLAKRMNKFFNLNDEKIYMMKICDGAPVAFEVDERGKTYEIPCDN